VNGTKIRELRKKLGYGQTYVAEKLGVKQSYVSQIERNEVVIPNKHIDKLCEILKITKEDFLTEEESSFNKEYLLQSIEIIDSIYDASEFSKQERVDLLEQVYKMVKEFFEKKLSPQEMELELQKLEEENRKKEKLKRSFFEVIKNRLTKNKNTSNGSSN
jgi:transcriptional regulator with XRE-family HTH domain